MTEKGQFKFGNLNNSQDHFREALADDPQSELNLYNEVLESQQRYGQRTLLDSGGMKEIYTCIDQKSSRKVALASLKNPNDSKSYEKFIREARITASLEHPNIIPVYDVDVEDTGEPFFTMKYVKGYNLADFYKKEKPSIISLMQTFTKICDAISYAHSKKIVHLDLKPANIQIDEYGEVLVCDWGIAKLLNGEEETSEGELDPVLYNDYTMDGIIKGSPGYLAPEQISNDFGQKDEQSDVFALGGILYYMLTAKAPFSSSDLKDSLKKTISGSLKRPSELGTVHESLEAVCLKALSVQKEDRYESVLELKNEIDSWLKGFATKAENAGLAKALWLLFKRHKMVFSVLVFTLILSTVFLLKNYYTEKKAYQNLQLYVTEKSEKDAIAKDEAPRLIGLSQVALSESRFDEAKNLIELAVLRDSDNIDAWKLKSRIHFFRQEFKASLDAFSRIDEGIYKRTKAAAKHYAQFKKNDSELLEADQLIELINTTGNKIAAKQLFEYASNNSPSLDYQLKISLFYLKEIDNSNVKNWHEVVKVTDGYVQLDFSGHKKLDSLFALRNLPISKLNISNTTVSDIEHLIQMPLNDIDISHTKIMDPRPLLRNKGLQNMYLGKEQFTSFPLRSKANIVRKEEE